MMRKRVGLCLLVASVLAACGPISPVDTDVKQAGANVFYGVPSASPVPSLPPLIVELNPVQSFPAPVEQPPVVPQPVLSFATPNPCPSLSPLSYPAMEATPAALRPPAAGTYAFRHTGSLTTNPGTPSEKVVQLPQSGTREVTNVSVVGSAQDFSFDVVDTFNDVVTTTSYHLYPQGAAGTLPTGTSSVAPGAYITQVVTKDLGDPSKDMTFTPLAPGVEIFPFPASPAATWESAGTDPLTGTTVVVGPTADNPKGTGTITDHTRVNACGTPIDAWEATLQGEDEYARGGPNGTVSFTLTVDMATQYGGLIVGDYLVENYKDQQTGVPTNYAAGATINVVPAAPPS